MYFNMAVHVLGILDPSSSLATITIASASLDFLLSCLGTPFQYNYRFRSIAHSFFLSILAKVWITENNVIHINGEQQRMALMNLMMLFIIGDVKCFVGVVHKLFECQQRRPTRKRLALSVGQAELQFASTAERVMLRWRTSLSIDSPYLRSILHCVINICHAEREGGECCWVAGSSLCMR